jgi:hypothetical protein
MTENNITETAVPAEEDVTTTDVTERKSKSIKLNRGFNAEESETKP